jgi:hypothetical protein
MAEKGFDQLVTIEVHQATGMVAVQLDCTLLEALSRMIVRARNDGITLDELAADVIDRKIIFSSLTCP